MNNLSDLQVSRIRCIELGMTNILGESNMLVLDILGERFLIQLQILNGSNFNFRFPRCPALPLLLFVWECVRVSLHQHLSLLVFLQLRVCPKLKASPLSEWIQWILGLPGFSWNLKINMVARLLQLTPHEGICRTLDVLLGGGSAAGGGSVRVADLLHSADHLRWSGFLD